MRSAVGIINTRFEKTSRYLSANLAPTTPGLFSASFNTVFRVASLISSICLNLMQLIPLVSLPRSFLYSSAATLSATIAHT